MRLHTALSGAALAALVLAGCSGSDADGEVAAEEPVEPASDEAGEPVTLSMANPYGHLGFTPAVEYFVEQVEALSEGDLRIQVINDFGDHQPDGEQQVVSAVATGDVDVAWVGTRVFDTLGLSSFQALHAPFLVDSYAVQAAIIDSDIPDRMLAGLDDIGVTGLAVLAGGLRVPVGVDGPLLEPDDYAGIAFQFYRSDTQANALATLGATPTDVVAGDRDAGLASGEIDAHEHSLLTYVQRGNYTLAPYLAANTILWPETQALIINPDVLGSLTDVQAGWLYAAAADAAARSAELHDQDTERAVEACEGGARFAEASDAQLTALREAVEPVYAELSADQLTAELIAEIESLKQTVDAEPLSIPDGCTGTAPGREGAVAEGTDDPGVLNGTYRVEWTVDELVDAVGIDEPWVGSNAGVVALTFNDGDYTHVWETGPSAGQHCDGTYAVTGNRVTMVATVDGRWDCGTDSRGALLVDAAWELTSDQLILSDFVLSDEPDITWWNSVFYGDKPLTRID
jgi:TRAP-type transport system periplasmic protein